ncbi:MAG: amidohydrolase [Candidatus Heimdallarchaeota archaeon]
MTGKYESQDLCLINGNIITMDPTNPKVEAMVTCGEKIIGVGTNEEMKALGGETTKVIDLEGKTVLPGFIDCHVHLPSSGALLTQLNLKDAKSIEDIKEKIQIEARKKAPGAWIVGRGWDNTILAEKRFPTRWDLDAAAPNNPVLLVRICTHIVLVNSKALELVNITRNTESPPGGQIDKDPETNELTGILRETATSLVRSIVSFSDEEYLSNLRSVIELAVSKGVTSIHSLPELDLAVAPQWKALQTLLMHNELPIRIYFLIPKESLSTLIDLGLSTGFGNSKLKIGSIKVFMDGALGGRTAALLDPYSDDLENSGIQVYTGEQLQEIVKTAHDADNQLAIHCIGDKAVTVALNATEITLEEKPKPNHRHRIEHASVLSKELIRRMRKLGVIASVQPPFIFSDTWISDRVGEKRSGFVHAFKSMLNEGIKLVAGSDAPTEAINPLFGIQILVTRETSAKEIYYPEEQISVEQAIRMYTRDAAYASFEEQTKGSIEPGKLADLVVLSDDPIQVTTHKISEINVDMTIVGGKIVYSKM